MPTGATPPEAGHTHLVFEGTFPTEPRWIGDDPDPDHPAGREVIEFLAKAADPTFDLADIWNEEGFGWAFNCQTDEGTVSVLAQYPDHWLVIVSGVGGLPSILGAKARTNATLALCSKLHGAMAESPAVTRHRWLTADEYDALARAGDAFW